MSRIITKSVAAVALSAGIAGFALAPAQAAPAAPAPATAVADSGSSSGSGQILAMPLSLLYLAICGMWGASTPNPNPLCNTLSSLGSGSA